VARVRELEAWHSACEEAERDAVACTKRAEEAESKLDFARQEAAAFFADAKAAKERLAIAVDALEEIQDEGCEYCIAVAEPDPRDVARAALAEIGGQAEDP
jgi:hypothetical protein